MKKYFPLTTIIICIIGIFVSFKYLEKSSKEKTGSNRSLLLATPRYFEGNYYMILRKDYRINLINNKKERAFSLGKTRIQRVLTVGVCQDTIVAEINLVDNTYIQYGEYSATTNRHIKAFKKHFNL